MPNRGVKNILAKRLFHTFFPYVFRYEQGLFNILIFFKDIREVILLWSKIEVKLIPVFNVLKPHNNDSFPLLWQSEIKCIQDLPLYMVSQCCKPVLNYPESASL